MSVKEVSVGRKLWVDEKGNEHWIYEAHATPIIREGDDPMDILNAADLLVEQFLYKKIGKEPPIRVALKPSEPVQLEPSEMPMLTKVGRIMEALGSDLCEELNIDDGGQSIIVQAKQYWLGEEGKQKWKQVNDALKQFGATWHSAGVNSRWEIPK